MATRKEALSIRPLRKKGAGKKNKTDGPTLSQANSVEAESRTGETNASEIEACRRQEGSRKDEARPSEKGTPEVQNSADEIDESRGSAKSLREDRFEEAAARQVNGLDDGTGRPRRPISVPDTNTRPAASYGRRPRTDWRTRGRTGSGRRQAIAL